jgi:hypothetical protein
MTINPPAMNQSARLRNQRLQPASFIEGHMTTSRKTLGALCVLAQVAGCAGNGDGLDASGRPISSGGGGGPLTPDFASIQANVFTPICTQCHVGANAPQGLRLDAANSYGALVGVASSEQPGRLRVKPGDPANSYLIQKLEGSAAVGSRMPLGQPALPDSTIQMIREWIASGATRAAATAAGTFAVETVSTAPTSLAIAMTRPVDATLVNGTTVRLQKLDMLAGEPASIASRVVASPVNDSLVVLTPSQALDPGQYRLTLRGTGPAALADWNAEVLDGDGDGTAGGDYVVTLTIGGAP